MLAAIRRKINGVKIMRENAILGNEVEGLRGDLAKMLTSRVKAATGLEGVSSEVARHEAQIETTRLEREKTLHKALEAEGLNCPLGSRCLVHSSTGRPVEAATG